MGKGNHQKLVVCLRVSLMLRECFTTPEEMFCMANGNRISHTTYLTIFIYFSHDFFEMIRFPAPSYLPSHRLLVQLSLFLSIKFFLRICFVILEYSTAHRCCVEGLHMHADSDMSKWTYKYTYTHAYVIPDSLQGASLQTCYLWLDIWFTFIHIQMSLKHSCYSITKQPCSNARPS